MTADADPAALLHPVPVQWADGEHPQRAGQNWPPRHPGAHRQEKTIPSFWWTKKYKLRRLLKSFFCCWWCAFLKRGILKFHPKGGKTFFYYCKCLKLCAYHNKINKYWFLSKKNYWDNLELFLLQEILCWQFSTS